MSEWDMAGLLRSYGFDGELYSGWRSIRCLFHDDAHASARACLSGYYCNSCPAKGDAISLIMEVEHCDFGRALEIYEGRTGDSNRRVRGKPARKSWGIPPFGSGDNEGDDREVSSGVRKFPDLWA